jgi:Tol biopolymer transport system component
VVVAVLTAQISGCGNDVCSATAPECAGPITTDTVLTTLAFATNRDGNVVVYSMRSDGLNPARLTNNPGRDHGPRWSPDGTLIAWSSVRAGAPSEIWVMNADGTGQRQVTSLGRSAVYPDWSADGTRIVFQAGRADGGFDIHVINADGTNLRQLTTGDSYVMPRWSPDGQRIAVVRCGLPSSECFGTVGMISTDGGTVTVLPLTELSAWPEWSPDGLRLAVASWRDIDDWQGRRQRLTVMNADGSGPVTRTTTEGDEWSPAWSRVTGRIFFVRGGQVFSMRPDGSDVRRASAGSGYAFTVGAR